MSWRAVGPAGSFGSDEAISFISRGTRRSDPTWNNIPILADMMDQARGRRIDIGPGDWYVWEPTAPLNGQLLWTACLVPPSGTHLKGLRDQTALRFRAAGTGGDPNVPSQIAIRTTATTAMARSTHYNFGDQRLFGLYGYVCTVAGTTAASAPASLGTIFSGSVVDGTAQWVLSATRYRGLGIVLGNGVTNCTFEGLTIDGGCPWQDGQPIPTGIPAYTQTHDFKVPAQTIAMLQDYNAVTNAFGFDAFHKGIWIGGVLGGSFGQNVDNIVFRDCVVQNWRGETPFGDGGNPDLKSSTLRLERTTFTECPGPSTSVGLRVRRCRFIHVLDVLDRAHAQFDVVWTDNYAEDCGSGVESEQGLLDASIPGSAIFARNIYRNIYRGAFFWNTSGSAVAGFDTTIGLRIEDEDIYDCAWNVSSPDIAAIRITDGGTGTGARGVSIRRNKIHVGPITAPARTGGTASSLYAGVYLSGKFVDLDVCDNMEIYDKSATAAGNEIIRSLVQILASGSSNGRFLNNKWRSKNGRDTAGSFYFGLSRDNNDAITVIDVGFAETLGAGATASPQREFWGITNGLNNTITTIAGIGNADRWEVGQIIELVGAGSNTQIIAIPATSAAHAFPGMRLLRNTTKLFIQCVTDPGTGAHRWVENAYYDVSTKRTPTANVATPTFQTLESLAPLIEAWGCESLSLAPVAATNFGDASHFPDDVPVTIYVTANATIQHNRGGATVPCILAGAANFTSATGGFVVLKKPAGRNFAYELSRVSY